MANLRLDEVPSRVILLGVFNLLGSKSLRSNLGSEQRNVIMNPFIEFLIRRNLRCPRAWAFPKIILT